MATSHYDALKTYAATTDGVASAAFGFEPETFAPTYQLLYRIAWPKPRARDRRAARLESVGGGRRAAEPERARGAARRAPREDRSRHAGARARAASRRPRTGNARRRRSAHAPARRRAPPTRGDVPPPVERGARDAGAPGAPGDRRGHRRSQVEDQRHRARGRPPCGLDRRYGDGPRRCAVGCR